MPLPKQCVLFDKYHSRMTLAQSNPGNGYNWLFLAGGPGADSEYFNELIEVLDLPGNVWLISDANILIDIEDGNLRIAEP